jgi:hypothetical protein
VFLAVRFVDHQSRLRWSSFFVLLYLAGGGFGFLATQVFQVAVRSSKVSFAFFCDMHLPLKEYRNVTLNTLSVITTKKFAKFLKPSRQTTAFFVA